MKHLLLVFLIGLSSPFLHAEALPDFTDLVEKQVGTVVNISTTTNAKQAPAGAQPMSEKYSAGPNLKAS